MGNILMIRCIKATPVAPLSVTNPPITNPPVANPPPVMRAINEGRDDVFKPVPATGLNLYACCVMYFIRHAIIIPNEKRYRKVELGWNWMKENRDDLDVEEIIERSLKPHRVHPSELWAACEFVEKFERDFAIHTRVRERPPLNLSGVPYPYNVDLTVVVHAARAIWDSKTEEEHIKDRE
jgi:hypothetical protein